jgi:hypothetical protein
MKRIVLFGISVGIVIAIAFAIVRSGTEKVLQKPSPSPTPYSLQTLNTWNDLTPGSSTLQDVTVKLGQPTAVQDDGKTKTLLYPSLNPYWKNEVILSGDAVSFIRERIFPPSEVSLKTLSAPFSEQPTQLYGPDFEGGTYLFVYPRSGIGFQANSSQDTVYQIWRFPPTTLQGFLALPQASDFGIAPKPETEGI